MSVAKFDITIRNLLIVAGVVLVLMLIYRLQLLVTTFAVSFFLAYLFDPVIDWFEEHNLSRLTAILLLFFIILLLLLFFLSYLLPVLYEEAIYFINELPGLFRKALDYADAVAARFNTDISFSGLKEFLIPKLGSFSEGAVSTMDGVLSSVNSLIGFVLNLALIPILTFYFLKDFDSIRDSMFEIFSRKGWASFPEHFMKFNQLLSRYFRGQILVALILGILYTVTLLVAGVKPAILVGMVSGVLSIVPYLGFIIGLVVSVILAVAQYGDVLHPLMVIAGFSVAQALEGNVITPKIVGSTLNLHPTAVIFALMAGGSLMGISGMIIALPLAAFLKVLGSEYILKQADIVTTE